MERKLIPHGNLVEDWYDRYELADFDKFIYLWISFNAWLAQQTQALEDVDHDAQMISWFSSKFKVHYLKFIEDDSKLKEDVEWFSEYGVYDMKKGIPHKPKSIDDFKNLMTTIYKVRCNLFHGGKSRDAEIDREIVTRATRVLAGIFGPLFKKYREGKQMAQHALYQAD